ncbi:MAG: HAMP domain-containing sensor histidine kinase [Myxococcota bacterium]
MKRRRNPLLGYFRRRLRRRLFAWFGLAIVVAGMLTAGLAWLGWRKAPLNEAAVEQFATHRFEAVWDDDAQRAALAQTLASDLAVGVRTFDATDGPLETYGPACDHPYRLDLRARGRVELCGGDAWDVDGFSWVPLVVGGLALWFASGVIAFRLTRPLAQLVRVTKAIGEGDLDARMRGRVRGLELRAIADAVNDMADRIQAMLSAERALLASVSHEIRTPLGHLRVLLDTARSQDADPRLLDELDSEVEAIDQLVGQLLAESRLDADRIERRPLNAVELTVRALERANVDPTVLEADGESVPVQADATLLLQALANVLRNADEHGGGVTNVNVARDGDDVCIHVDDAGPGFDDLERAFESGYQGADGKGALGLGLALVRRVAEAHGGAARAHNLDPGARVTLRLPSAGTTDRRP